MASKKDFLLSTTVIAGVAALSVAVAPEAWAQAAPDPQGITPTTVPTGPATEQGQTPDEAEADEQIEQGAPDAEAQNTGEPGTVEALVVTGSRIRRNEFTAADPIQVITSEQASLEGIVDTGELLQESSLSAGSTQINNLLATGFVVEGGGGVNTLSLRGLGANRTLVLLNGRRAAPAGVSGTVSAFDLNVIPQSAISRVEILKSGASSVYGSDAIAGVVNIITRTDKDGGELNLYYNQPFESGGEVARLSGTWGKTFNRGYFNVSGDYYHQEPLRLQDRDYLACSSRYFFSPTTGQFDPGIIDPRTGEQKCFNLINNVIIPLEFYGGYFQYGNAQTANGGQPVPPTGVPPAALSQFVRVSRANLPETFGYANYDSEAYNQYTLLPETNRYTAFLTGGFDVTPGIEAYAEVLLNRRETIQDGYMYLFPTVPPATAGNPLVTPTGQPIYSLPVVVIARPETITVDYARFVGGVRGTFSEAAPLIGGWDWDVHYQHGRSEGSYTGLNYLNDAVEAAAVGCQGTTLNTGVPAAGPTPISGRQCVPINLFSQSFLAGNFSQAERDFLLITETGNTEYTQQTLEGVITGELFNLPAGPVGVALGAQWRRDEIDDQPGANAQQANYWGYSTAGRTAGEDSVRELFGEVELPLLKGVRGAEDFTVTASARYSDYESYGSSTTYKAGANWQISPAFRLRATYGTSFRAPALYELFLAGQTSFLGQAAVDPCVRYGAKNNPELTANCNAVGITDPEFPGAGSSAQISAGGGIANNLEAETSDAMVFGVIWTPRFIDLSVAVDYFEINVENEVAQFGAGNIVNQCYTSPDFPNDPFCSLVVRETNPASPNYLGITNINDNYVNLNSQENRGIDLTLRHRVELPYAIGTLTTDAQATWQLEDVIDLLGGTPDDDNGEIGDPDFVGNINMRLDRGDWTVFWGMDFVGKQSNAEAGTAEVVNSTVVARPVARKIHTEFTSYHRVSIRRAMNDWTFQLGIQNIFDERPPNVSIATFGTAVLATQYDYIGRRAFVSIGKKF